MPSEYTDFYNKYRNALCRKTFGITTVSKQTLESRIRKLMDKAIAINNKELAQVACDLAADEFRSSSDLLSEMDALWRKVVNDEPEHVQRADALRRS